MIAIVFSNHAQKWGQICSKSVQLVRSSPFRNDLLQNPYFKNGKKSAKINEEELEPVRDQPDVATADTRGHQHVDQPDTGGGHQRQVPKALHMRFQAELHQMESIEEAERQLNQLNRLRDVATARNEAVTAANYVQVQCTLKSFKKLGLLQ